MSKALAWMKIARLQFYPMAWIAYSLGAACAATSFGVFSIGSYLIGYFCLFLLELCTVLGILPYIPDLQIEDEDSLGLENRMSEEGTRYFPVITMQSRKFPLWSWNKAVPVGHYTVG